ncbi:MAG: transketolase C-terminal domain-containing protein, partial [Ignavibacteriaceae bacterium]|nr:transketolase C-terminal domain-containing protein [Ignavibacteriaceae bacterium]
MTYEDLLIKIIENNQRFMVLTAENRAAIRNLPERIGKRFLDVGIAEQTLIGMSAGLALRGKIPIVHSLASFLTMRAFEFVRTDIGILNLPVKLVGGVPGFLSEANGPTHQAIEDISLMRGIPGMNIFCPADEEDLLLGLPKVLDSESPFYIRYNNRKPAVIHDADFEIGKAEVISKGHDVTILTYGFMLEQCLLAKKILEKNGYSVGLINLRTLKPIDTKEIIKALHRSDLVVTVEDHFITGGLYSIVCELIAKEKIEVSLLPVALKNRW